MFVDAHVGDLALRLSLAVLYGALLGLNRDLRQKGAGLRTFGLVALATATLSVAMADSGADAQSRLVQGVLTGIGFLGAGVIMRRPGTNLPAGLTTSAAIWLTSVIGLLCGLGHLLLATVAFAGAFLLLVVGRHIQNAFEIWLKRRGKEP